MKYAQFDRERERDQYRQDLSDKPDQVLENQKRVIELFEKLGNPLTEFAEAERSQREALAEAAGPTVEQEKERAKELLAHPEEEYGLTCTQPTAAKILGISARTVGRLLYDNTL